MDEVFKENPDSGLFDDMGESLVLLLKQQAVYEFFATNDVACPHCNHDLDANDLMDLPFIRWAGSTVADTLLLLIAAAPGVSQSPVPSMN